MSPFPSIAIAFEGKRGWTLEWIRRRESDDYVHTAFHETQDAAWFRNAIEFGFHGRRQGQFHVLLEPESINRYVGVDRRSTAAITQDMGHIIEDSLLRVALISHPENYVVKRTPKLTPREQRRVAVGEPIPNRKRPYYEVLDHAGLVRLRQESLSPALKLPLPHARRGHWMRLAERCREARAAGKEKVWRREAYVGDRKFETEAGGFEVYLSAKEAAGVVNAPRK